jgi:hypothetical protein
MLGSGDGHFTVSGTTLAIDDNPDDVAVVDLNRDGILDVVLLNSGNGSDPNTSVLSVFLGLGGLAFTANTDYLVDLDANALLVADLNGDGILDASVVTGYGAPNGIDVLLGDGTGSFPVQFGLPAGNEARAGTIGDFDRDGRPDFAINDATYPTGTVAILLNTTPRYRTSTFTPSATLASGLGPTAFTAQDLNRDGIPDLAFLDSVSGTIDVAWGIADGGWQMPAPVGLGLSAVTLATGDVNRDRRIDLLSASANPNALNVFLAADGGFQAPSAFTLGGVPIAMVVADLNRDGADDAAVLTDSTLDVVFPALLDGGVAVLSTSSPCSGASSLALGDFNRDGISDLAVTCVGAGGAGAVQILLGDGTGAFAPLSTVLTTDTGAQAIAVGDINRDAIPDLAVACGPGLDIALGIGDGTFAAPSSYAAASARSVSVADLDGDGQLDVILVASDEVLVLVGLADGGFSAATPVAPGSELGSVLTADLNRDGVPDLTFLSGDALSADGGPVALELRVDVGTGCGP